MLTKTKMTLVAALVLGSASGALAQSYDPSIGTGNIAPVPSRNTLAQVERGPLAAHAQVRMSFAPRDAARPVLPFTAAEQALFNRIPKE
jgi:hypothetical protein